MAALNMILNNYLQYTQELRTKIEPEASTQNENLDS